jgi:hypothetical protein
MRETALFTVAALALVGSAYAGCSSTANHGGFSTDASTDSSGDDASSDDGSMEGPPNFSDSGDDGGGCTFTCSSDLHQVLGCNNAVVQTCPADQGCAGGKCLPACQAAQANQSTVGCDYFTYNIDAYQPDAGDCFAAYIANTWGSDVTITVDFGGTALTNYGGFLRVPSGSGQSIAYSKLSGNTLPAGQVAIVFLANTAAAPVQCPTGVTAAYATADAATHGTGIGTAFHISTDRPVVAYDIYPYGGGISAITSATLLIPTTAWDTNYVASDAYTGQGGIFSPWISVVAQADNTSVTISPTATIAAGAGVMGTAQGVPHTWMINRGQVLQFTQADGSELNGSPIQTTKPVAVFGGITCMDVPTTAEACDAGHQEIPPVRALGHEYVWSRQRDRYMGMPESPPVRLIGAVDKTTLTYDPAPPAGAPTTLAARQMVEFTSNAPFVVKSQDDKHPFYLAAFMTGCTAYWGSSGDCRGDPEYVNVVPPQEYLPQYTFFTDPTYPETELVVVREKNAMGKFDDVSLDCLGSSVSGWQPVGSGSKYEFARIDLVTGNFMKVGNCDNGRHEMHSNTPFGLTVWGWGSMATGGAYRDPMVPGFYSQAVSYAYPAGMSVQPITTVVVPPTPM